MKVCVLMASPKPEGNTATLVKPFVKELLDKGAEVTYISLESQHILPCQGCFTCQQVEGAYGCPLVDDVEGIIGKVLAADTLILASPIYSWYCTPPLKALLDRFFGLSKFYGRATGSLWAGKKLGLITSHGYDADYGAGPFEQGIRRLCDHAGLHYQGMFSVQDKEGLASFISTKAVAGSQAFARSLLSK